MAIPKAVGLVRNPRGERWSYMGRGAFSPVRLPMFASWLVPGKGVFFGECIIITEFL